MQERGVSGQSPVVSEWLRAVSGLCRLVSELLRTVSEQPPGVRTAAGSVRAAAGYQGCGGTGRVVHQYGAKKGQVLNCSGAKARWQVRRGSAPGCGGCGGAVAGALPLQLSWRLQPAPAFMAFPGDGTGAGSYGTCRVALSALPAYAQEYVQKFCNCAFLFHI